MFIEIYAYIECLNFSGDAYKQINTFNIMFSLNMICGNFEKAVVIYGLPKYFIDYSYTIPFSATIMFCKTPQLSS